MVILRFYHTGFWIWNAKLNAYVLQINHGFFNSFAVELILRYLISIFSKQMAFLLNNIWTPQPRPCSLGLCWGEVNCKDFFWNSIFNGGAGQRQTTQVMRQRPNILISSSSASAHTEWGIHTQDTEGADGIVLLFSAKNIYNWQILSWGTPVVSPAQGGWCRVR